MRGGGMGRVNQVHQDRRCNNSIAIKKKKTKLSLLKYIQKSELEKINKNLAPPFGNDETMRPDHTDA